MANPFNDAAAERSNARVIASARRDAATRAPEATPAHWVDHHGLTFAQRLRQFTVEGWAPNRVYTVKRGSGEPGRCKSWGVMSPSGQLQDCVETKREAVRYAAERNSRAAWAHGGGIGPIPGLDVTFHSPAPVAHHLTINGTPFCAYTGCQAGRDLASKSGVSFCGYATGAEAARAVNALSDFNRTARAVAGPCPSEV